MTRTPLCIAAAVLIALFVTVFSCIHLSPAFALWAAIGLLIGGVAVWARRRA